MVLINSVNLWLYRVTDVIGVLLHVTRHAFSTQGAVDIHSLLFLHLGLLSTITRGLLHLLQTLGQTPSLESTYGKFYSFHYTLNQFHVYADVTLHLYFDLEFWAAYPE
jgi:hypothetical protein